MIVDVYCKIYNINYEFINFEEIEKKSNKNSAIYIVNPNGVNGEAP